MQSISGRPEQKALGLKAEAMAYITAAASLERADDGPILSTKHILLCHAIELILKAYVASRGDHEGSLLKVGHDLEKRCAGRHSLDTTLLMPAPKRSWSGLDLFT